MFTFRIIIVLSAGFILLMLLPASSGQVFQSTYPSTEPGFAAGMKNLVHKIQEFIHGGYGWMLGGPTYVGTFSPAMPPLTAPPAGGAKGAGPAAPPAEE